MGEQGGVGGSGVQEGEFVVVAGEKGREVGYGGAEEGLGGEGRAKGGWRGGGGGMGRRETVLKIWSIWSI